MIGCWSPPFPLFFHVRCWDSRHIAASAKAYILCMDDDYIYPEVAFKPGAWCDLGRNTRGYVWVDGCGRLRRLCHHLIRIYKLVIPT